MTLTKLPMILAAGVLSAAGAAHAEQGRVGLAAGVSTLGPVAELSYRVQPKLGLRAMGFGFGLSDSGTFDVEDYTVDGRGKLGGLALVADYYPTGGNWRISGGVHISNNKLSGTFTGPQVFTGKVEFENKVAPMLTAGYEWKLGRNSAWSINGEIGAVFTKFKASSPSTAPAVVAEVDRLNDELDDLPFYPYIGLTVSYSF